MARLKVFRTSIGFHDAYVAATSRKAALAAWGSDKDLFARGVAEEVVDPALTKEALAAPGTVIRRLRGTEAEQIAALPKNKPAKRRATKEKKPPRAAKPKPRPSREALDEAERRLAEAEAGFGKSEEALAEREAALAKERRDFERERDAALAELERARASAERSFRAAMERWRG